MKKIKKILEDYYFPVGLKLTYHNSFIKLYSSDRLKEKFYNTLIKSSILSMYNKEIKILINKNKLIPCFSVKGIFNYIFKKNTINYYAFYDRKNKKIYIILNKNFNRFFHINSNQISKIVIHELIHTLPKNNIIKFKKIFYNDIYKFYNTLFKIIFDLKEDIEFTKIEKHLDYFESIKILKPYKILCYLGTINKEVENKSNFTKKEILQISTDLYLCLKFFYFNKSKKQVNKYLFIYDSIKKTYLEAFNINIENSFFYQELLIPSEIIAILYENSYYKNNFILKYIIRGY